MTREELNNAVEAVKNGDRSAFEKLYDEYYDPLRFYISKSIGSLSDAEDIAQDTFVTVLEKIGELRSNEAFKAWLYKIATNKTNAYFNQAKHIADFSSNEELESVLEQAEEYSEPLYVSSDYMDSADTQAEVRAAIDELSADRRSALIMFYYENMKIKEIAAAMGINENAVGHRLTEARKQIAKKLKKGGRNLVLVPLPMVLLALGEAEKAKGGVVTLTSSPAPAAAAAGGQGAAAIGSSVGVRVAAAVIAAAVIGGTSYSLFKMKDNSLKGDVRFADSSVTDSLSDSSRPTVSGDPSNSERDVTASDESAPSISAVDMSTTHSVANTQPRGSAPQNTPARPRPTNSDDTNHIPDNENNENNGDNSENGGSEDNGFTPENSEAPSSSESEAEPVDIVPIQQQLIDDVFYRSGDEYDAMFNDNVTQDPFENSYAYAPISNTIMDDMMSVVNGGYLPAGGYVYVNDRGDNDSGNDFYVYMFPVKRLVDVRNGNEVFVVGWLAYRHNYSNSTANDSDMWEDYYVSPDPFLSVSFESNDPNADSVSFDWQTQSYWRRWDRSDGAFVQQGICFTAVKSENGIGDVWSMSCESFTMEDIAAMNKVVLTEDIPLSEDLELITYLNENKSSYSELDRYYTFPAY